MSFEQFFGLCLDDLPALNYERPWYSLRFFVHRLQKLVPCYSCRVTFPNAALGPSKSKIFFFVIQISTLICLFRVYKAKKVEITFRSQFLRITDLCVCRQHTWILQPIIKWISQVFKICYGMIFTSVSSFVTLSSVFEIRSLSKWFSGNFCIKYNNEVGISMERQCTQRYVIIQWNL